MELGLSLGKAAGPEAARTTPELGLGLGVGAGSGRRVEGGGGSTVAAGGRWWATAPAVSPEPAVRLSLVSTLGLQWPPSESAQPRAFCSFLGDAAGRPEPLPARGFDVNRAPSVSAASAARLDEDEDNDERALSSSPNDGAEGGGERSSSRASDEDEGASARKKLRLSKEQSAFLEESFRENNTLNTKQKAALARQLNLRPRQVEVWFQNRRARTKLKQTEVDCEYLKRCCETLTAENRRLHKELAELRALKTAQPFYTHLPATTLSMCPSCERVASNPASTSAAPASLSASPSPAAPTSTSTSSPAGPAPPREDRPSSFAALFAATRSFPLASQPRPQAPASNCL